LPLSDLLDDKRFRSGPLRDTCYILSGGLTGYLIRRFGWERYKTLFRRAVPGRFKAQFHKVFGLSLDAVESQWQYEKFAQELLARKRRQA
jgi:hypothetical protein